MVWTPLIHHHHHEAASPASSGYGNDAFRGCLLFSAAPFSKSRQMKWTRRIDWTRTLEEEEGFVGNVV